MIFIVTGQSEGGLVSATCASAVAALSKAHALAEQGAWDLLIDADGQEYAPADFRRRFVGPSADPSNAPSD